MRASRPAVEPAAPESRCPRRRGRLPCGAGGGLRAPGRGGSMPGRPQNPWSGGGGPGVAEAVAGKPPDRPGVSRARVRANIGLALGLLLGLLLALAEVTVAVRFQ